MALGYYSFLVHSLSKKKRDMRRPMCKIFSIEIRYYSELLTELNVYLAILTGSDDPKKMVKSDNNKTLLHNMPNRCRIKPTYKVSSLTFLSIIPSTSLTEWKYLNQSSKGWLYLLKLQLNGKTPTVMVLMKAYIGQTFI